MAGEFYISGLSNSGFDYQSYLDQYRQLKMIPINQLQADQANLMAKQQALSAIHEKISAFTPIIEDLENEDTYDSVKADVSNTDVLSVSVDSSAVEATYHVEVMQIAKENTYKVGTVNTITDIDQAISGNGTLTINYLKDGSSASLSINYENMSLKEIMEEINGSDDLRASIINLGTSSSPDYQLIISPVKTGVDNRITGIDDSLNPGDDSAGVFSEDSSKTYETESAQDAIVKINGIEIQNSSNSFENVISGVSLNVKQAGTSDVEIKKDNSNIKSKLESLFETYNDLIDTISSAAAKGKPLAGESSLYSISSGIFRIISDNLGKYGFIDTEGTAETTKGHLIIKEDAFKNFMEREDAKDIIKNFASILDSYVDTYDTDLGNQEKRYDERISYIDRRISTLTDLINKEIESMRLKFSQLEIYLSKMQSLQARIENFMKGLSALNDQNQ